jgi:Fe2+ or Zn2+ uptake regulation protein
VGAAEIERLAAERGFTLTGLTVEAHGRCEDCAA